MDNINVCVGEWSVCDDAQPEERRFTLGEGLFIKGHPAGHSSRAGLPVNGQASREVHEDSEVSARERVIRGRLDSLENDFVEGYGLEFRKSANRPN